MQNDCSLYVMKTGGDELAIFFDALMRDDGSPAVTDEEYAARVFLRRKDRRSRRPMGDRVFVLGGYFVVSDRCRQLFEQFRCQPGMRWIPVLPTPDGRDLDGSYWLISPSESEYVKQLLNPDLTEWKGPGRVRPKRITFDLSNVPPFDFFVADFGWFCTGELKRAIEQGNLSGFSFEPVTIHHDSI